VIEELDAFLLDRRHQAGDTKHFIGFCCPCTAGDDDLG
jgi:hypothetical protein